MIGRAVLALLYLGLGATGIRRLWLYWTPYCNEVCELWRGLTMYATTLVLIVFTLVLAVRTARAGVGVAASVQAVVVVAVIVFAWALLLTVASKTRPYP